MYGLVYGLAVADPGTGPIVGGAWPNEAVPAAIATARLAPAKKRRISVSSCLVQPQEQERREFPFPPRGRKDKRRFNTSVAGFPSPPGEGGRRPDEDLPLRVPRKTLIRRCAAPSPGGRRVEIP